MFISPCCKAEVEESKDFSKLSSPDQFMSVIGKKKVKKPMYVCGECGKDVDAKDWIRTCEWCDKPGELIFDCFGVSVFGTFMYGYFHKRCFKLKVVDHEKSVEQLEKQGYDSSTPWVFRDKV